MAKENDCANSNCDHEFDIATLMTELAEHKKKTDELTTQNKAATDKLAESDKKLKEATDTLDVYVKAEKKHLVEDIAKRSDLKADELDKKDIGELRIIQTAIDHVKVDGTVKPVRGAAGTSTKLDADPRGQNLFQIPIGRPKRNADGSVEWVVD
jgi:hypothetical protein